LNRNLSIPNEVEVRVYRTETTISQS
jgi:hypothetical protein